MSFLDNYEPVEDRLRRFWDDHPAGRVVTDLIAYGDGGYIVKALVFVEATDPEPTATGYAQETTTARGVNSTSALENCETSAIGRALANLGYAPKGVRPSREEMASVRREPEPMDPHVYDGLVAGLGAGATVTVDELRAVYVEATRRGDTEVAEAAKAAGQALKEAS